MRRSLIQSKTSSSAYPTFSVESAHRERGTNMNNLPRVSVRELAHKIKGYGNPRFAFFLGAGASRQSNIITATEMMRHFKERIISQCCPDGVKTNAEKDAWL